MDPKSGVVKSKSSNSGISKARGDKKQTADKKSRSNAAFPLHGLKKRGVYVEKRLTKINLANDKKAEELSQKPPIRPRAGQKKFLASVLTILSKSTTGTQYPEADDNEPKQKEASSYEKDKKYKNKPRTIKKTNDEKDSANITIDTRKKKENFKSRVLSRKIVGKDKKMVVLQSRKEIAQTPSNYSEWSYKDASQRSNTSNYFLCNEPNENKSGESNVADDLKNAILEGRNTKTVKRIRYLEDEPNTLVSEVPKDPKLYNFFVDLLETTISVYNVKAEYDAAGPSDVSKVDLQINESVAKKLNVGADNLTSQISTNDVNVNLPNLLHVKNDLSDEDMVINMKAKPMSINNPRRELRNKNKLKKLKTDSFIYQNKIKTVPKTSKSVEIRRKTKFKNKNDLINVLKQELEIDTHVFEEPKSIFQALKVMARNKKKKISFDTKPFTDECIMKRRNIISSRRMKKNKNKSNPVNDFIVSSKSVLTSRSSKFNNRQKPSYKKGYIESDIDESSHSLQVFGVDYETKQPKTPQLKHSNDITLTYHSSNSELDFDVNDAILNPASAVLL